MSKLYKCCSDGSINSQEYNSFEINDATIKIFMTEYHQLINSKAHEGKWGMVNLVYFHFFKALNDAFEVQFLQWKYC